jgi:quercetin dioxygenase-like cupin family protein
MNDSLQIPLTINVQKLNADLQICLQTQWKEHFNDQDYMGSWTGIALRSQSGNTADIFANNSDLPFIDTPLLFSCTYFQELLNQLLFEKETVRLLRLQPGSIVKEHRDNGLAYRFDCFRLHIPIVTAANVAFKVGGNTIPLKEGECWYADFDLPHSVINDSEQERIHLVIDGKRNTWTDELFAKAGYDFEEEKRKNDYSIETKLRMIEQLRFMNTTTSEGMIKKLEAEINETMNDTEHGK